MTLRLRSGICDLLKQYHDIKIASGTKAVSIDRYINYIDDFYFNNNFKEMVYTKEMNSLWLKERNDLEGNYVRYTRNNYLIDFLSFVTSLGYGVYIPRRLPYKSVNFIAYIFSEKELEKYFEYIDSFFSYKDPMVALYVPIIFRILIGCGTRIGETLALKVEDVDIINGIIHLKETKNSRFRAVPISDSLLIAIKQYDNVKIKFTKMDRLFFTNLDRIF